MVWLGTGPALLKNRHPTEEKTMTRFAITLTAAFALSFGVSDAGAWPSLFRNKPVQPAPAVMSAPAPVAGSAQVAAGRFQMEKGMVNVKRSGSLFRGAVAMRVQAIGLSIQGNRQQANRMRFGARSKEAAIGRGFSGVLSGIFNQGVGNSRAALAQAGAAISEKFQPVRNGLMNTRDSIASSRVVVGAEILGKATVHGVKGGWAKLRSFLGNLPQRTVKAAQAEGLSPAARMRLQEAKSAAAQR
jgi:hypothetical protein